MNPFEMVVMIVAIVTIGKVLSNRYGSGLSRRDTKRAALGKMLQPELSDSVSAEEAGRMKSEIRRLNDRLAVLERARQLQLLADQKAERDRRYAARKARR
jgi:hypothetical protein